MIDYPRPDDKNARHCWLTGRLHQWGDRRYLFGLHRWKCCENCNAKRIVHHVSCPKACWGGYV